MGKKNGYLIIGAALIDVLASTDSLEKIDISRKYVEHLMCLSMATKTSLKELKISSGGSALNVAVAMDNLGAKSALLTCLGKDAFGDFVLERLARSNTDSSYVKRSGAQTGIGISLFSSGEKSLLVYHGAVDELGPEDISASMVKNAGCMLITSLTSPKNYALFIKTIRLAAQYNVPVVFAPSITMLKEFEKKLRLLRHLFDIVIMNYEEASILTRKKDIRQILRALPGRIAVVTKDVDGAFAKEGKKLFHVNSLPVTVKSTTGAGDVFCGAFVHTYYKNHSVSEALRTATAVAAVKLGRIEADAKCTPEKLGLFLKKHGSKIKVKSF